MTEASVFAHGGGRRRALRTGARGRGDLELEKAGAFPSFPPRDTYRLKRQEPCSPPSRNGLVVQSLSRVRLFLISWTTARQASLSITNSWGLLKLMSIELVMPSNHLTLCRLLLLLPSIFPRIRVFSNDSSLHQVDKGLEFQLQHQSFQ